MLLKSNEIYSHIIRSKIIKLTFKSAVEYIILLTGWSHQ